MLLMAKETVPEAIVGDGVCATAVAAVTVVLQQEALSPASPLASM
jgi:hypothetical protein